MKTKNTYKNQKLTFRNLIAWLLTLTVLSIIFILIALPISWLLMHGFNWICSVPTLNFSLDYWPMFAITLCLMVMFVLISILSSKSSRVSDYYSGSKVWQNELDRTMADDYARNSGFTYPDNDEFWDPYD